MKLYPPHDPSTLEPHYCRHVEAMTAEGLHKKSDIAAQLAWRDRRIAELEVERDKARSEREHAWQIVGRERDRADAAEAALKPFAHAAAHADRVNTQPADYIAAEHWDAAMSAMLGGSEADPSPGGAEGGRVGG